MLTTSRSVTETERFSEETVPMGSTITHSKPKATFRRRDKYLYVARTIGMPPSHVVAVCVFLSAGIGTRKVAADLALPHDDVVAIKIAAEPFLRKPKASRR